MQLVSLPRKSTNRLKIILEVILAIGLAVSFEVAIFSMFSIPIQFEGTLNPGESFIFTWNSFAESLGHSDYLLLTKYASHSNGSGMFFVLLATVLTVLNYLIIRNGRSVFLIIYVFPLFITPIVFSVNPGLVSYACAICVIVTVFSYLNINEPISILPIIFIFLIISITGSITTGVVLENYTKPIKVSVAKRSVENFADTVRYGENLLGGEDFPNLGNRKTDEKNALELNMEIPQSLYLRGFVGSSLGKFGWENLSNSNYYDNTSLYYWLHKYRFSGLSQLEQVGILVGENIKESEITVKNVGTNRKYVYMPYETTDYSNIENKNYSDEFIRPSKITGAKSYTYTVSPNMVKDWPSYAAKIFTKETSENLDEYKRVESHYNVDVYKNYTAISQSHKALLSKEIGISGNPVKGHIDYKLAINNIRGWLEKNIVYTEKLNAKGGDFLKNFIKNKKGYDVHYASAATVMFRYYGIPARYVEGYLITPDDVKGLSEKSVINITNKNKHAWTEIYIDTLGWVPLEVTPEYYGLMEDPDLTKGLEDISVTKPEPDKTNASTQYEKIQEKGAEDNTAIPWLKVLLVLLSLLLLVILFYLLKIFIQKFKAYYKRKKAFAQADNRAAVCAMYSYMLSKSYNIDESIKEIGEKAAYSLHEVTKDERIRVSRALNEMKGEK